MNCIKRFCYYTQKTPTQLVQLSKVDAENLIQNYGDELLRQDKSKSYLNDLMKKLKAFYTANGYTNQNQLEIHTYYQPARYRKRPEYIPTKKEIYAMANAAGSTKNRAIILTLWSTGLRISTLTALNISDIQKELDEGHDNLHIPVYPEMKEREPDACKGLIPYYSFTSQEATTALKTYLAEREEQLGKNHLDYPLFHSDWHLWNISERSSKRLGRRGIGKIVKNAAKYSGIPEWEHVSNHCLRKAFESVLRDQTIDGGRLDKGTQEFFFGHILSGSQDTYYDKSKIEYHRDEYSKLDFKETNVVSKNEDKLIKMEELKSYLSDGWRFVSKVTDELVVVRK